MGGTLEPEETPGGGLTMMLSLPAVPAPELPPADPPGEPGAPRARARCRCLRPGDPPPMSGEPGRLAG